MVQVNLSSLVLLDSLSELGHFLASTSPESAQYPERLVSPEFTPSCSPYSSYTIFSPAFSGDYKLLTGTLPS